MPRVEPAFALYMKLVLIFGGVFERHPDLKFVFTELGNGLRRNLSMHVAVVLTLFVSLTLVGVGVLLVRSVIREVKQREELEKEFKNDLKKRIDETAKYIRPEEGTLPFAFMFIPAEGIYYDLLINDVGGAVKRTCVQCEHFYFSAGKRGYSELTPESSAVIECNAGVWSMTNDGWGVNDRKAFRLNIAKAETCDKFQEAKDE